MQLNLKPSQAKVREYFNALHEFGQLNISHESAVRHAFASLLDFCARQLKWKLVPEFRISLPKNRSVIVDGAVLDLFSLRRGYWEAKDLADNLEKEIKKKFEAGYPRNNIIFQTPERAILYQNGIRLGLNEDITGGENLVALLKQFFDYREPQHEEWEQAVEDFTPRIPEIAAGVKKLIEDERRRNNKGFAAAFAAFVELCRQAINPNLSEDAVETMLIQHLLTERIFRKVFDNPEFTRRNIIAAEIEKVIATLTSRHFSRDEFLKDLDHFYRAIEDNARNATDYAEKQSFLNTVYERFFQGFSPKEADTHGIVYTPQPIVEFMVRSVEEILKKEFGKTLSDRDVHILDPFVGTGNFITRVMREIKKTALPHKYANELHCNEVMLLPYYIASMNIEHAYLEATGEYRAFEGICLVDTFELAEGSQNSLFTAENTARVEQQRKTPIFVIIGNPPYNVGQINENDNNKNRKYKIMDRRIADTYARQSVAINKNALGDAYVKAFRWASDRIGDEGVVAFVSNNGFIDGVSFDGMRKDLRETFSSVYHLNLKGNARTSSERRRREGGNVFDDAIRVSVGITLLVKTKNSLRKGNVFLSSVDDYIESTEKKSYLEQSGSVRSVEWLQIKSSSGQPWADAATNEDYSGFLPIGNRTTKEGSEPDSAIFSIYSRGVETTRDAWVYQSAPKRLESNIRRFIETYNQECERWHRSRLPLKDIDSFLNYDDARIKWSSSLKWSVTKNVLGDFKKSRVRLALYRPFQQQYLYFDDLLIHRRGQFSHFFPTNTSEIENRIFVLMTLPPGHPMRCLQLSTSQISI